VSFALSMPNLQDPEMFRAVLDSLPTGVCVIDRSGRIALWNQGAERIAGHRQHEVLGHHHDFVMARCKGPGGTDAAAACPFTRTLHDGKPIQAGMLLQHKQGHSVPVLMHFIAIRDSHGSILAVAASFDTHNSNSRRARDRRIAVPSGCADEITGLANHGFTQFHLRENFAAFAEYHIPFGIICMRADELEHFRAAYGHAAKDSILHVMAQNLSHSFRPSDFVGRWGEDEFIAVLVNCGRVGVEKAFHRLYHLINRASILWWGEQLSLTTSLGCASVERGDTPTSLVQRAERSLTPTHATIAAAHGTGLTVDSAEAGK
jgi:diguanylate cyclase (GGDEF)-like protein/PAS domain S-box-containing protein